MSEACKKEHKAFLGERTPHLCKAERRTSELNSIVYTIPAGV